MANAPIQIPGKKIGRIEIHETEGISISKELGFYRLKINTKITINCDEEINSITNLTTPVIFGDVTLKLTLRDGAKNIGHAFPESPVWIQSMKSRDAEESFNFFVDISQKTLDAIEEVRSGGDDLFLVCSPEGVLFQSNTLSPKLKPNLVCCEIQIRIPQSDWCQKLVACGYCEIMLVEINISNSQDSILSDRVKMLKDANQKILLGHYVEAISDCRKVLEKIYDKPPNFAKAQEESQKIESEEDKKKKKEKKKNLSKEARIYRYNEALFDIINLSHHADNDGAKNTNWNKKDAKLVIGGVALLLQLLIAEIEE